MKSSRPVILVMKTPGFWLVTSRMTASDPLSKTFICHYREGFFNPSYLGKSFLMSRKNMRMLSLYFGLSPFPVIVEMKVYRDSLLKM